MRTPDVDDRSGMEPLSSFRGVFAFAGDEGFRVIFRRADGGRARALAWVATALVLAATIGALLREPVFNGIAWMIGGLIDFALIYVIHALRHGLSQGGMSVDGAERRIFLPEGAELAFERLRFVSVRPAGSRAELVLLHDVGSIRLGERPAAEVEVAAQAVARVAEIQRIPWSEMAAAQAG